MNITKIGLATIASSIVFATPLSAQTQSVESLFENFDGTWVGEVSVIEGDSHPFDYPFEWKSESTGLGLKIDIESDNVRVYSSFLKDGEYKEVKAGKFKIFTHKTNATIYAIDSSEDVYDKTGHGGWVESWNMTLTRTDTDSVLLYYVRAVNNYLLPSDYDNEKGARGRYVYGLTGILNNEK